MMCDEFLCFKAAGVFAEVYSVVPELSHSFITLL